MHCWGVGERRGNEDARVVDHRVEPAEPLHRRVDDALPDTRAADVTGTQPACAFLRRRRFGSRVSHPRNADRKIRGSAMGLRWTRNRTSRLAVASAVLLVMKKTGLGERVSSPLNNERGAGRNGISTTAF